MRAGDGLLSSPPLFYSTTSMSLRLTIIVAIDLECGIGVNNTLPWHLPEDLAFFKRTTSGHPIIMGRKTFDSIGKPLPNRRNIVITRNLNWTHAGVDAVPSLAAAIEMVNSAAVAASTAASMSASSPAHAEAFIIGGAQIFAEALPHVQRLLVTEIDKRFDCDTFLPPIDRQQWQETARETHYSAANACNFAFVTYERQNR
jgi:dihydrofolate reductase